MLSRPRSCGLGLLKATYLLCFLRINCSPGSSHLAPFCHCSPSAMSWEIEQLNTVSCPCHWKIDHRGCVSGRVLFIEQRTVCGYFKFLNLTGIYLVKVKRLFSKYITEASQWCFYRLK